MSFRFRFESLLELRRRQRDEAGARVGDALAAIAKIDQQRDSLRTAQDELRDETSARLAGTISVDSLLTRGRYQLQLAGQSQQLAQTRTQLELELANRQQTLADAEAEVKRFERLEQKERRLYDAALQKQEQFENDEASLRKYATTSDRRHRQSGVSSRNGGQHG